MTPPFHTRSRRSRIFVVVVAVAMAVAAVLAVALTLALTVTTYGHTSPRAARAKASGSVAGNVDCRKAKCVALGFGQSGAAPGDVSAGVALLDRQVELGCQPAPGASQPGRTPTQGGCLTAQPEGRLTALHERLTSWGRHQTIRPAGYSWQGSTLVTSAAGRSQKSHGLRGWQ
ncbi:hypothetical protein ACIPSA_31510 [Streptomyces sp. NPDC086549]|uniref:hypothetical protein n=1 Tax=Streptomyces sp. NPDC086549 TaxID=3365752 RepID=UPI0038239081